MSGAGADGGVSPKGQGGAVTSHVWLIRHGQASFGAADYDKLSALGARQARLLGEWLAAHGVRPERLLVGTLKRQQETAAALAEGLAAGGGGAAPDWEIHSGFNENDADSLIRDWVAKGAEAPSKADRKGYYRTMVQALLAWHRGEIHGSQSFVDYEANVADALRLAADGARPALAVSSGGTIGQMVRTIMGSPPEMASRLQMQVKNASVTRLAGRPERLSLLTFNETPHLDATPDLITWS